MNAQAQALIHAVETADSSAKLLDAVENLAAAGLEESVPMLIAALGYNNPGAAVAAVDGLIKIGEPAVQPLLELIDDYNYGARAWAVRALAGIGDPRGLDILLEAAQNDFALSVRRAAARGLGTLHWEQMPATELLPAQHQVFSALIFVCADPEWIVRYAAVTGLESLAKAVTTSQPSLRSQIVTQLEKLVAEDTDTAVRTRVFMAQQQILVASSP
jgi:phycocyanobilin lyase beta subunit